MRTEEMKYAAEKEKDAEEREERKGGRNYRRRKESVI